MTVSVSVGNVGCLIGKTCVQVPSSPLLPAALPALLGALTGACQQGGDAALAKRLQALLMAFTKGQAQALPSASGPHLALFLSTAGMRCLCVCRLHICFCPSVALYI